MACCFFIDRYFIRHEKANATSCWPYRLAEYRNAAAEKISHKKKSRHSIIREEASASQRPSVP